MRLIYLNEPEPGSCEIERAWRDNSTFALIPAKSNVSSQWLGAALDRLPAHLRTKHFCLLSSGSTGEPKLFVGSRYRARELAATLHVAQQSEPVRQTIIALPLSYSYAFVNQWVWSSVYERPIVFAGGLGRPDDFRRVLRNASDAMLCLTGPQAPLLPGVFGREAFPEIIRLHFAGGRFPQEQLPMLRSMFPSALIFNNYGCVEAMPRLTVRRAEAGTAANDVGSCLPGVELQASPSNELMFRSRYGAVAQVDPSGVKLFSEAEWVRTGDLAEQDADGRWRLLGRSSELFKRYGEKIALPRILTTVSRSWEGQAGLYREKDQAGEDGYVLVIAPAPTEVALSSLLQAMREDHRRPHWPLRIESAESLPTLPNGKIDTAHLQTLAETKLHWRQRI